MSLPDFKPKGRPYNLLVTKCTQAQEQQVDKCCNSWIAKNTGDSIAFVNQVPVIPRPGPGLSGETFGPEGDEGDIYKGRISVTFAAGANPELYIIQFIYLNIPDNG